MQSANRQWAAGSDSNATPPSSRPPSSGPPHSRPPSSGPPSSRPPGAANSAQGSENARLRSRIAQLEAQQNSQKQHDMEALYNYNKAKDNADMDGGFR